MLYLRWRKSKPMRTCALRRTLAHRLPIAPINNHYEPPRRKSIGLRRSTPTWPYRCIVHPAESLLHIPRFTTFRCGHITAAPTNTVSRRDATTPNRCCFGLIERGQHRQQRAMLLFMTTPIPAPAATQRRMLGCIQNREWTARLMGCSREMLEKTACQTTTYDPQAAVKPAPKRCIVFIWGDPLLLADTGPKSAHATPSTAKTGPAFVVCWKVSQTYSRMRSNEPAAFGAVIPSFIVPYSCRRKCLANPRIEDRSPQEPSVGV